MIIARLMGGLGNQMFQYAAAKSVSVKFNDLITLDVTEFTDKTQIKDYTVREFGLDCFNVSYEIAPAENIPDCLIERRSVFQKLTSKILITSSPCTIITEDNFHSLKYKPGHIYYLNGYWQSEYYFKKIRSLLLKEFTLKNKIPSSAAGIEGRIRDRQSVSLHIRRGDYVANKVAFDVLGPCSLEYYYNCVNYIKSNVSDPYFFIFSDDTDWVKNNFRIDMPFEVVENITAEVEMNLMSKCKHNIIANSSFSWWGAWLNTNAGKIVIAPKVWFKNQQVNRYELVPPNWIKI